MGFAIYKQGTEITDLKASVADEQAKNTQLQMDLDNANKTAAAVKAAPVYKSPLSTFAPTPVPTPAPTATPTPPPTPTPVQSPSVSPSPSSSPTSTPTPHSHRHRHRRHKPTH